MLKNRLFCPKARFVLLFIAFLCGADAVQAGRPGWKSQQVDLRITTGARIKALYYPQGKPQPLLTRERPRKPTPPRKKSLPPQAAHRLKPLAQELTSPVIANVIDSPPLDGFVPWVAVTVTSDHGEILDLTAVPTASFTENYLPSNPQGNFALGIFDTGASVHLTSYDAAVQTGLDNDYLTPFQIEVTGVTGSVEVDISMPLGIFMAGLGAIEPNGLQLDTSGMVGQTNVAVAVGNPVDSPNVPTVIGAPLAVYFTADFRNGRQVTVTYDGNDFNSPNIRFYEHDDPRILSYSNIIPLELRPLGGAFVQYVPNTEIEDLFDPYFGAPASPSTIIGNLSQSVFFVHSVDLYNGDQSAVDKDRFMLDTGAQITVVGSRIAARLRLDPADPNFEVLIQGVTGDTITAPGFYIDSLEIPALGEWLTFTNVPVVLLDVASPEGGTVDGIIGMNLFVDLNFVLRGGGLFLQDDPSLEFEPIGIIADIAPAGGDSIVNHLDLAALLDAWLSRPDSDNWNPRCDLTPFPILDGRVDFLDFAVLAEHWKQSLP